MALPSKLTHEEQALLNKFALLKRKKKEIAPAKSNHANVLAKTTKQNKKETVLEAIKVKPTEPKDAKEKAKLLIASGKIKIKSNEKKSFKRARPINTEKKTERAISSDEQHKKIGVIRKESYQHFVPSSNQDNQETDTPSKPEFRRNGFDRRQGNCLFVQGHGLTKQILDSEFPRFGKISSIYMESEKNHGTVTYDNKESADKAIKELHGNMAKGVVLRVMYSRKRPYDDNRFTYRTKGPKLGGDYKFSERMDFDKQPLDQPPPEALANEPKRKDTKEKRQLVTYDEDDDFF